VQQKLRMPTSSSDTADTLLSCELSIILPCLNEAETLGAVLDRASRFLRAYEIEGEIIVADNGSTDSSIEIAELAGARVVNVGERGYGAALIGGIEAANGKYVAMADADDSYDFMDLMPFVHALRSGKELVMGNRFHGGIARGAMPNLHRYLGNPVLSFAGRLFYSSNVGDFHCGLRAFDREAVRKLHLTAPGMEFASEMVIKAQLAGLKIAEVPATLSKDGRSRPPHLRSWRDGWRHLKILLLFSPRWLYVYPGLTLLFASLAAFAFLLPGFQFIGGARLGVHSLFLSAVGILVGNQLTSFGLIASVFGIRESYWFTSDRLDRLKSWLTVDRSCLVGGMMIAAAFGGVLFAIWRWAQTGYGDLAVENEMRIVISSVVLGVVGLQLIFTSFLIALLGHPRRIGANEA